MLETLRKPAFAGNMLKHCIFISLFVPLFSSETDMYYAPDFILANLFALLGVGGLLLNGQLKLDKKNYLGWLLAGGLGVFLLVGLYYARFHGWYGGVENLGVSFALFVALLFARENTAVEEKLVRFLLEAVLISNILGIVVYLLGNDGVWMMDGIRIVPMDPERYERRYNWVYLHKSQYAFMMVLFLALTVTYRHCFTQKWTWYLTLGVLVVGLVISHTYASMAAAMLIFLGALADRYRNKFYRKHLLLLIPVAVVGLVLLVLIAKERDLLTLGGRTLVWKGGLVQLMNNFDGRGAIMGSVPFHVEGRIQPLYNCHNLFLNWMLQMSVPAGLCCTGLLGAVVVASVWKNPSFRTLGIWGALLIPMMMDWCILPMEMTMVTLVLYLIFFSPLRFGPKTQS